jgi:hypothetical protein
MLVDRPKSLITVVAPGPAENALRCLGQGILTSQHNFRARWAELNTAAAINPVSSVAATAFRLTVGELLLHFLYSIRRNSLAGTGRIEGGTIAA